MIGQALTKNIIMFILGRGPKIIRSLKFLEETQWLKREAIIDLQEARLEALIRHAYENVPYYQRIFKERKLRPGDIKTVEDLKKLPPLKKVDISRMQQELMARNISQKERVPHLTSGTTGAALKFFRSREDICWGKAAELRAYGWGQYELGDKYGLIWVFPPSQLRNPRFRIRNLVLRQNALLDAFEISDESMRSFARRMERSDIHFLRGYSPCLYMLAKYLLDEGIPPPKLRAVFSTSHILLPSQRRIIEKAFDCEVYDFYGSREVSSIASECHEHSGFHIQSENVVMEFIKDGEEVAAGETGAILITNLNNYAMPFIRYDIGDTGKPSNDICPCGRSLPLFKSLEGRTIEFLVTRDGSVIGLKDFDRFFADLPVRMFQIIQESYDEILIRIVKDEGYSEKDTQFIIENILYRTSRDKTGIEVEIVNSIPSIESGKKRYLISKLPTYSWVP